MLSEIVNSLRLPSLLGEKCVIVTKDIESDVNFVFSELLSHYISKKQTVVLLNFAQSCAHYNHMLLKSGINMRQLRENQQIITIDGLSEIEKLTLLDTIDNVAVFSDLFSSTGNVHPVQSLFNLIKETVQKLSDESKQFVIFIDDISSLLNLGVNIKHILLLIQYCRALCINKKGQNNLLLGSSIYEEEDLNKKLVDYILHIADVKIQVEGLKTGYSKDFHGKITLGEKNLSDGTVDYQKMLYKVTEKGAKLFPLEA